MSYGLYITYSMYNKFLGQMFKKKKKMFSTRESKCKNLIYFFTSRNNRDLCLFAKHKPLNYIHLLIHVIY